MKKNAYSFPIILRMWPCHGKPRRGVAIHVFSWITTSPTVPRDDGSFAKSFRMV